MNNISFAEILDGLEKDVFDLVSNFERQINSRLASSGSSSRVSTSSAPAKPFQPKWKGLRSVLRWLWKGQSKDNPDYAHFYNDKQVKKESNIAKPTLAEYLAEIRAIEGFADEICVEILGGLLAESSTNFSDVIGRFKMDFRNIILKYKNLVKNSVPSAPEVAPAAAGRRPVAPAQPEEKTSKEEPEEKTSRPTASASEKASDSNASTSERDPEENPPNSSQAPREEPQEKDEVLPRTQGQEEGDSPASDSSESGSARKSKSHSSNIGRWFKEAMEAKKKGGDELKPKAEWLNPKGIVKPEKLPWVIAWMGTKSHKDLHKDEDVQSELQAVIGSSFKDFVPQIAKKKSDSLVGYLRKNMPMVSDDEFKRLVSELYGSEYNGPGISSQKKKREKKDQADASDEGENDKKPSGPDIQELRIKTLSSLYDGMDSKEKILDSIEDKIVEPIYDKMESDEDAEYFGNWWKSFKSERSRDAEETVESLIVRINSGAMFDDILKNSEVSKNKPEKKIKLRNLMNLLKV